MSDPLSDAEIDEKLSNDWTRDGDEIVRTYEFDSYLAGVGFASGVGGIAQEAYHHPEITIGWQAVELRFTTHDVGAITQRDIDLAARCDSLFDS